MNTTETKNALQNEGNENISKLISAKIEKLRPKLLDLTRRNPLLSTKFTERSNSLIRIVDEVPEFLLADLIANKKMRIVPLPDLEENPKDEASREYQAALSEGRLNDTLYLEQLEKITQNNIDAPDLFAQADRQLKDRLREKLGMPLRQTKNNPSIEQHAKNNGISPFYTLPSEIEKHEDGRHTDKDIQTLLLPDVMERRLNQLYLKEKTWKDESGISVLHAAFGFLEWQDGINSNTQFSPLILVPVEIEKKRTSKGQEFWVSCDDDSVKGNSILAEKMRLEFNVILPDYKGQGIEVYFKEIQEQWPKGMKWRIRRWATIGVFPSARFAMYHDLDPDRWDFASNPILSTLFAGTGVQIDAAPFGDEYEIDSPEIEKKVPHIIADADASQFSTIVDIADGKNLAVEGPPGTGKSQTIVNTIAAALFQGKKVLFVAEKSAALNVVFSRLDALGLGEFILPLQATLSNKSQIIASLKSRVEMEPPVAPIELNQLIVNFKKAREDLAIYLKIVTSIFKETGFSVHTILGKSIKHRKTIDALPKSLSSISIANLNKLNEATITDILDKCKKAHELLINARSHGSFWEQIQKPNIDPFTAKELLATTKTCSEAFNIAADTRKGLLEYALKENSILPILLQVRKLINDVPQNTNENDWALAERLSTSDSIEQVDKFLESVKQWHSFLKNLESEITELSEPDIVEDLFRLNELYEKYSLNDLKKESLDQIKKTEKTTLNKLTTTLELLTQVKNLMPQLSELSTDELVMVTEFVSAFSRESLGLRNNKFEDPSIQSLVKKAADHSKKINLAGNKLEDEFSINNLPDLSTIKRHQLVLAQNGFIKFVSIKFWSSINFYKSISLKNKPNRKDAAENLARLSEWINEKNNFVTNEQYKNLFGNNFEGLDTNITLFEEVVSFYEKIDQAIPLLKYPELHKTLKSCEFNIIKSIPSFDRAHPIRDIKNLNFDQLTQLKEKQKVKILESDEDLKFIQQASVLLKNPEKISANRLLSLIEETKKLFKEKESLRNDKATKLLLGLFYAAEKTNDIDVRPGLELAKKLTLFEPSYKESIFATNRKSLLNTLSNLIKQINTNDSKALNLLTQLEKEAVVVPNTWFDGASYESFSKSITEASRDQDGLGLIAYSRFFAQKNTLEELGFSEFIDKIINHLNASFDIPTACEALIFREMSREVYKKKAQVLTPFTGETLSLLRKNIKEIDKKIISLTRQLVRHQLFVDSSPPNGNGTGLKSSWTEMALINNEISKKKRHIPIRKLTERAKNALLSLKPCWMMSPLAVSQYLPHGESNFDLLIIDEASQMTPEDAIGAILRVKQVMVVGDTNQLPPTNFFRKVFEDEFVDEDEQVTEESILEMANACFKPSRRLRWHYRSRHSGLINFSNNTIYDDNLVVFPSAQEDCPNMGVSYKKIEGIYSTGTNPVEAKSIVDAASKFMRTHPERSLGIVTLNQKQSALIIEEMEFASEQYSWIQEYKDTWKNKNNGLEEFFIKNLENVQGDERDVIYIGTVYGPEKENAPVMQRFGPINGIAGKRRLNVLFTRAKKQIITFSSMTPADIKADEDANPGVHMLGKWLKYSATGVLHAGIISNKTPDSDFEEHVIKQIQSIGCETIPQVGVKGFSIDIGVRHPSWPNGFIMGVECDGATYHSSKSARDRDRLRQEVLESLGWNLYRIWSTDWFENPLRETKKLKLKIEERLVELKK